MLRFLAKYSKPIVVTCSISATTYFLLNNNSTLPRTIMAQQQENSSPRSMNKDHHDGSKFRNPWNSASEHGFMSTIKALSGMNLSHVVKEARPEDLPEKVDMNWKLLQNNTTNTDGNIVVTWLGHACALVQINGYNVLFDPIFSCRCSPVQFVGPKRYTNVPCELDALPKIDLVIISHNHYDHLDSETIQSLAKKDPNTRFFVPLGNKDWFGQLGNEKDGSGNDRVVEMDWWESTTLELLSSTVKNQLKVTCTPCQHFSGRGILDRNKTLWASWCIEGIDDGVTNKGKVFFGGDTGYRSVPITAGKEKEHDEKYLESLPHCPAFKDIGEEIGPFDISLIPIGAYSPRWFMSTIHCSPEDAVRVHEDVKSKHSIGIHWGTFALTDEPVQDPPRRLELALANRGHSSDDFNVLKLGESYVASTRTGL